MMGKAKSKVKTMVIKRKDFKGENNMNNRETEVKGTFKKAKGITNPLNKRLYDLKEAATYLGRPVFSVRTLIWNGALPYVKEGRKFYLDIFDMDTYIERNKTTMI